MESVDARPSKVTYSARKVPNCFTDREASGRIVGRVAICDPSRLVAKRRCGCSLSRWGQSMAKMRSCP